MERIEARMIIEIMGRPAAHITNTMGMLLEKLGKEKGVAVKEKKIHTPVEIEKSKDLFTTFAEVDVEFDSLENYIGIMFAYMPANVEIISPVNFRLTNDQMSSLGNSVITRLHFYDAVAKKLVAERDILTNQLKHAMQQSPAEENMPKRGKSKPSKAAKSQKKKK